MRVWDVSPGYLNRQSLLGEHAEIHALISVLEGGGSGYRNHPETLRWHRCPRALVLRHDLVVEEMILRGFAHHSPVPRAPGRVIWPGAYVDDPCRQLEILASKYADREAGRIPLPRSRQELWAAHKYSVLARDPALYRSLGRKVAGSRAGACLEELARTLTQVLRTPPRGGPLRDALQHMWGHVRRVDPHAPRPRSTRMLLEEIRRRVRLDREPYLAASTALGELGAWVGLGDRPGRPQKLSRTFARRE